MKRIIISILLLGLAGCGFVFENLNEGGNRNLSYRMSKDEVTSIIGAPQKQRVLTIENKEYELWEYPGNELKAGKIKSLGTYYYKVFFLEGKVVSWEKDKIYAQPGYEFLETIIPQPKVATINKISDNKVPEPQENLK